MLDYWEQEQDCEFNKDFGGIIKGLQERVARDSLDDLNRKLKDEVEMRQEKKEVKEWTEKEKVAKKRASAWIKDKNTLERIFKLQYDPDQKEYVNPDELKLKQKFAELYEGDFYNFDGATYSNCIIEARKNIDRLYNEHVKKFNRGELFDEQPVTYYEAYLRIHNLDNMTVEQITTLDMDQEVVEAFSSPNRTGYNYLKKVKNQKQRAQNFIDKQFDCQHRK